jgi:endonuclease/exonuclease/phosphatase family metal-dependent hydrolase
VAKKLWLAVVLLPCLLGCLPPGPPDVKQPDKGYLFCFWNTENLFDDQLDNYSRTPDKEYDAWFAKNPDVLKQKLENLSSLLVELNEGRGPDILAIAEAEGPRAAELLEDALNKKLKDQNLHYNSVLVEEVKGGRHICTAIITRLPVNGCHLLDKRHRILEGYIVVDGHSLVVTVAHWTSRVSDDEGTGREKYADIIYNRFLEMYEKNKDVDWLLCGDFNDTPKDDSVVKNLHASGDRKAVMKGGSPPLLLDLLMDKDPLKYGTHSYHNNWFIFDHIVVSPGMLDNKGWQCDPDSVEVIRKSVDKKGRPDPFGSEKDKVPLTERGWSDHLPVTVRLKVVK